MLSRQSDKYNLLYGKYYYGFEKEGRSQYYNEKAITGTYIPFKYPLKEEYIHSILHNKWLNTPIDTVEKVKVRPDFEEGKKEQEDEGDKENRGPKEVKMVG